MIIEEAGEGWLDSNVMLWFVWGQPVVNNGAEPWIFCSGKPQAETGQTGTIHSVHWLALAGGAGLVATQTVALVPPRPKDENKRNMGRCLSWAVGSVVSTE